jgi:hypothetical protein
VNLYAYVGGNPVNYTDPFGWEKVNLLNPGTDEYNHFVITPDIPGTIIIAGHGDYAGNIVSIYSFDGILQKIERVGGEDGMPIEIRVCGGGYGKNSIAQILSKNFPNSIVTAPEYGITPDGSTWWPRWSGPLLMPRGKEGMRTFKNGEIIK